MRNKLKIITFIINILVASFSLAAKDVAKENDEEKKIFNVVTYGAVGDGKTLNTLAIQKAIDAASITKSGGRVFFPKGQFLTGSIELKSNVDLYLSEGSIVLGSTDPKDYQSVSSEGRPDSPKKDDNTHLGLILAHNATNITLYGKGTIDGQGRALALTIDSLHHAQVQVDPNYNVLSMRPSETVRPKLFSFSQCKKVKIEGIDIKSSAGWGLSFELCNDLTINRINLTNRAFWNNDGMDITDCTNVRITNCDVNSADDGLCLKSYYPGYFNDNIYIANCTIRSSASAIKFGTASYGGFKNVTIEHIKIFDTFRSAIAIESVDGGIIENIKVQNIKAKNTGNGIFIRLGHRAGEKPGRIKNVLIKDIKVQIPFGRPDINYDMRGPEVPYSHNPFPASIVGIPGHYIENVIIENLEITYPGRSSKGIAYIPLNRIEQVPEKIKNYPEFDMFGELPAWAFYVRHVKGIEFRDIKIKLDHEDFRPAFVFDDLLDLKMEHINLPKSSKKEIVFKNVKNVKLDDNAVSHREEL
ncbi:glycoside hydrolase family 28 protein [Pedobacter sp. Leaf194]|uniref:glycoside hydrolase family 28 protein n=1 Tax=Pedobacter sp. Leaf194 TaxID=1736297 RepID=UPI0007036146|nr:glycosyl hydrolase family 28 protein [Pedobacter sp. Leaf194]KQS36796.1 glycoside hydrolase [Pedobacter sp. Leaf194]